MFLIESKFWDFILKNKEIIFFILITILAVIIRVCGFDYISGDMEWNLIPWYNEYLNKGGLKALNQPITNYNFLYNTVIAVISYIKCDCVYMYKIFSMIFDWVIAFSIASFVSCIKNIKVFSFEWNIAYSVILFLPTVIFNSSFWGQCDGIYTAFVVLCILYIFKKKYTLAFIFYGLALAFKLQAIFALPFLFCYYLKKREFSFLMFFLSIFVFWFSGIIAYINGADLLECFKIYLKQSNTYSAMYMNFPSLWMHISNNYNTLKNFAVIFTLIILSIAIYSVISKKKNLKHTKIY